MRNHDISRVRTVTVTGRLIIIVAVLLSTLSPVAAQAGNVAPALQACRLIEQDLERLNCYDQLSVNDKTDATQINVFQPKPDFIGSELRVRADTADFNLTIKDFVALLKTAITEDGKKIQVRGWSQEGDVYILHIHYRHPLQLRFKYADNPAAKDYSVLQPVITGEHQVDATQFVYTIAAMSPD